ncbi:TPA: hypothetical protein ACVO3F_004620, partial [Vibrio diabolicus]
VPVGFFSKSESVGTLKWERIDNEGGPRDAWRAKVHGGWLFITCWGANYDGSGATFIPDPNHQWSLNPNEYQSKQRTQQQSSNDFVQHHCVKCNAPTFNQINGQYKCGWCE